MLHSLYKRFYITVSKFAEFESRYFPVTIISILDVSYNFSRIKYISAKVRSCLNEKRALLTDLISFTFPVHRKHA